MVRLRKLFISEFELVSRSDFRTLQAAIAVFDRELVDASATVFKIVFLLTELRFRTPAEAVQQRRHVQPNGGHLELLWPALFTLQLRLVLRVPPPMVEPGERLADDENIDGRLIMQNSCKFISTVGRSGEH